MSHVTIDLTRSLSEQGQSRPHMIAALFRYQPASQLGPTTQSP